MQRVLDVVRERRLPKTLALRIHNFYEYAADKETVRDELALLSELPLRLRIKAMSQLFAGKAR